MRLRTLLIGSAAVVFGGSAAVGAYLLAKPSKVGADAETVSIVVAVGDVPRGTTLTAEMLALEPWPEDYLPETALRSVADAEGRAVWIPLIKGEPVSDAKLSARGAGRGMAAMIPRGMRAVTLQTPTVSTAMAGFILPGNKVDVLLTLSQPAANSPSGGGSSITLLQNVEVLAVDQRIDAPNENVVDPSEMQSVTLLVTPAEASRLDLGQSRGTLRLALRNPEDSEISEAPAALLSALRPGDSSPAETPEPQPEPAEPEPAEPETTAQASHEASPPQPPAPQAPDTPAEARYVMLPVRTLRGTSSGVLYLRRPVDQAQAVASHEVEETAAGGAPR